MTRAERITLDQAIYATLVRLHQPHERAIRVAREKLAKARASGNEERLIGCERVMRATFTAAWTALREAREAVREDREKVGNLYELYHPLCLMRIKEEHK